MEISSINAFLAYYEKTREATIRVINVIPPDHLDWAYMPGKFSIGDQVRHIAAIERNVFAEVALGNRPCYKGCRKDLADGYDNVVSYFNEMHRQSVLIFQSISDDALRNTIKSLDGKDIELGSFLRALVLHEIHHRAALCIYLNLLGVTTPPIIGLMEEQVIQLSK
jgi:uncharacterized damage-inducible protein DinB